MKPDPALERGIGREFVDGQGFIRMQAWNRAQQRNEPVGMCRKGDCGGLMMAVPTHQDGKTIWFGAACNNCGGEIAANDKTPVLRRSSRHQEMPDGAWDERLRVIKQMADLAKSEAA